MLTLAWKNLLFRKMRALLTILGVASSISLVVIMSAIMAGTEQNFLNAFANMAGEVRVQPKSDALNGVSTDTTPKGVSLSREATEKILKTAAGYDPANSSPVIYQTLLPSPSPNQPDLITLNGVEPGKENAALRGVEIANGEAKLTGERDLILGPGALAELGKRDGKTYAVGDTVTLVDGGEFTIKAITAERDLFTNALAVVPLKAAQAVLQRQDTVNFVILHYPIDATKDAAAALQAQLPEFQVVTSEAMLASVNKALASQRSFFRLIDGTVYCTAIAIIFMVMYTSVMERTREIGTMRAVGAPRWAVVGGILCEGLLFAVAGGLLATGVGYWMVVVQWHFVLTDWQYFAGAFKDVGLAAVIALISCLYPAIRAALINPLAALRYE